MSSKVSIITVCYNAESVIENTIKSIISQIDIDFQFVIIDGGSTDGTSELISKYKSQIDYYISEPDNGIYDAMNKGIIHSIGEWIIFMNAGDFFYDSKTLSEIFQNNVDDKVVLFGHTSFMINGKLKVKSIPNLKFFWKGMPICHQSVLVKRDELVLHYFDLNYTYSSDYDLLYKIYNKYPNRFHYTNSILSVISTNGFSESNSIGTYIEYFNISRKYNNSWIVKLYFMYVIFERKCVLAIKKVIKY